eukprot:9234298-Alexandrium_andersonii.AAC.1
MPSLLLARARADARAVVSAGAHACELAPTRLCLQLPDHVCLQESPGMPVVLPRLHAFMSASA